MRRYVTQDGWVVGGLVFPLRQGVPCRFSIPAGIFCRFHSVEPSEEAVREENEKKLSMQRGLDLIINDNHDSNWKGHGNILDYFSFQVQLVWQAAGPRDPLIVFGKIPCQYHHDGITYLPLWRGWYMSWFRLWPSWYRPRPSSSIPTSGAILHPLPRKDPLRVLQGGFHPDLVFMAPGLSESQRREAIRRVCGAVAVGSWLLGPPVVARTRWPY